MIFWDLETIADGTTISEFVLFWLTPGAAASNQKLREFFVAVLNDDGTSYKVII